jgi:cobalt transporter subunit CbtB
LSAPASATPLVVSAAKARLWILGTVALGLLVYYFVGVDQGALSVFGNDMHVHDYVHDARHLLGFPCH